MISITELAACKVKENLARRGQGLGIKIGVRTTGCSGLAYTLEYVDVEQGFPKVKNMLALSDLFAFLDKK